MKQGSTPWWRVVEDEMRDDPKSKGERSEAMILARFLRAGKAVLLPFGDNQRYDMVIDDNGAFTRVQCKTGRLENGCVVFNACSSQAHRGRGKRGYKGQADVFAVYSPELDKVFIVPVTLVGESVVSLRLAPAKNRQVKGVRLADSFEL